MPSKNEDAGKARPFLVELRTNGYRDGPTTFEARGEFKGESFEAGFTYQYQKLWILGDPFPVRQRLNPSGDHVSLKRDGQLVFWSNRDADEGWIDFRRKLVELTEELPWAMPVITPFHMTIEHDAFHYAHFPS